MMRKIIYIIIAIACLLLLFNITDVTVIDKSLKLPVSGASVNNFKTIDTGVAKFLDFSFDQFITVERIGYQTTKVKLSYRPVYRKITVEIDEADVSSLKEQINKWVNSINTYKYTLENVENNKTYAFTQIINGKNIYTNTTYNDGKTNTSEEIFVLGENVYVRKNDSDLQEITENKDEFLNDNLIVVPLSDVITDLFDNVNNKVVFKDPADIVVSDGKNTLEIKFSQNGVPIYFELISETLAGKSVSKLTIDLENTQVNLNEK
jgi:tRNA threonylcarbamoyladenosine modification (KEOPS) complex  Pcc1 subunit